VVIIVNISILKSKIHQATVTGVDMSYEGSIVIDAALMDEVGLHSYEKVMVANISTGDRFETYVIPGKRESKAIELNGATARLGQIGDRIIIFAFTSIPESEARTFSPRIIQLNENNQVVRKSSAA
jgi:aspartate 1-decarboxylase